MNRQIHIIEKRIRELKLFIRKVEIWERNSEFNVNNLNFNLELLKSYYIKKIIYLEKVLVNCNREKEKRMLTDLRLLFGNLSDINPNEYYEKVRLFQNMYFH